ncbi:MAG: alpha/beta hydrolase [Novosphingobium sp.]|nr:alpha/beta hydrolase [Novosphingobium sp.]
MSQSKSSGDLRIPERVIPVPEHLSPEAKAVLAAPRPDGGTYPALNDADGWRQHIAAMDAMVMQMFASRNAGAACSYRDLSEGDAKGFEIIPEGVAADDRRVYLDIHGGALIMGAGEVCKAMSTASAVVHQVRTVAVDYRMPPDHPFPVGLDDCMAFYRALLRDHAPREIIVGGGSAGGNLCAAMLLRARDEGLPMPAAAVLSTPEVDLTESGDTHQTNAGIDAMGSLMQANLLYAAGADLTDPYVSPLFGDFTKGFPPTIITAGTRDLFLSNAVRMHRKLRAARIPAELHIVEAAAHGNFGGAPEDAALDEELRSFCKAKWSGR